MSSQGDVRQFLASRRAKITPQQAGRASYGLRRVPGLRREEVAMLAGVSTDYYARWSAATLSAFPPVCWMRSPAPCVSTKLKRRTCMT